MKYLKKFNEAIDKEDIKDILLELDDIGLNIINMPLNHAKNMILISSEDEYILWEDVEDSILRLKDYIGDSFEFYTKPVTDTECYYKLDEIPDSLRYRFMNYIKIYYKN